MYCVLSIYEVSFLGTEFTPSCISWWWWLLLPFVIVSLWENVFMPEPFYINLLKRLFKFIWKLSNMKLSFVRKFCFRSRYSSIPEENCIYITLLGAWSLEKVSIVIGFNEEWRILTYYVMWIVWALRTNQSLVSLDHSILKWQATLPKVSYQSACIIMLKQAYRSESTPLQIWILYPHSHSRIFCTRKCR